MVGHKLFDELVLNYKENDEVTNYDHILQHYYELSLYIYDSLSLFVIIL